MFTNIFKVHHLRNCTDIVMSFCVNCGLLFSLQSELVDLAESIQQKLSYFNELENINTVGWTLFSTSRNKILFIWLLITYQSDYLDLQPHIKKHYSVWLWFFFPNFFSNYFWNVFIKRTLKTLEVQSVKMV